MSPFADLSDVGKGPITSLVHFVGPQRTVKVHPLVPAVVQQPDGGLVTGEGVSNQGGLLVMSVLGTGV